MKNIKIDFGRDFDFGKTSEDYGKYRDIYPAEFYEEILSLGLCVENQTILDIGTGTGVLPRKLYPYGGRWTGIDISENQIHQAKLLSKGMDIDYCTSKAEDIDFPKGTFDVITACQCFIYFDHEVLEKKIFDLLKNDGSFLVLYMAYLPFEDKIAKMSEDLVLKYNPLWSGKGERCREIEIPKCYEERFFVKTRKQWNLQVPFTRESWNGRMKSLRGIGAALSKKEIENFEKEHLKLLEENFPESFSVLHYAALCELKKK